MKNLLAVVVATSLMTVACSDDTVTPTTDRTYIPSAVGTYVINSNESYTTEGTIDDGEDSTVVVGTMSITDGKGVSKTGIMHITYFSGDPVDTVILAQEGAKIYGLLDLELAAGDQFPPVNLGTRWVLVADGNATSSWSALSETVSGVQFEYPGVPVPLTADAQFTMTCAKVADTTMTITGTSVPTVKYTTDFGITISIAGFPNPIAVTLKSFEYYGENVGLVRTYQDASTVQTPFGALELDGYNSVAVRYGKQN